MHNTWLIIKREYLQGVRTQSFIISTAVLPLVLTALMLLPAKLATLQKRGNRHLVIATMNRDYGEAIRVQLSADPVGTKYNIEIDSNLTETERSHLREKVSAGELDGYLWLPDDALAAHKGSFSTRHTGDFLDGALLRSALQSAGISEELRKHEVSAGQIRDLLTNVKIDNFRIRGGREIKTGGTAEFLSIIALVMLLYVTLLLSGIGVLRSVLEEKGSRVFEILLSSATPHELMAGKILGVGAVGLTQVLIWAFSGLVLAWPTVLASRASGLVIDIQLNAFPFFIIFYVLGYVLYSTMFAALGAMVNSEQEAQHWQMIVTVPLVAASVLMVYVMREPGSPLAVGASLIPFLAPLLMYERIVVQTPPWWQILACVAVMLATIWAMIALCSRIYSIGILMYGKKPNLPELAKWLRYAARS